MAWQDRSYYRDDRPGSRNPLLWLLSGSIPLFTVFGIRVRMHVTLLLLGVWCFLDAVLPKGIGWQNAAMIYGTIFTIVLLHEFGHCFAARRVGGDANQIILWPLGGLALADAPHRAWPQLVTTVGGPLVNVIICIITGVALLVLASFEHQAIQWNPVSSSYIPPHGIAAFIIWYVFIVSWGLLLFNLLPIFPLDGGRMLQELLWFKLGYYRATIIACNVGMVGAGLMAVSGLYKIGSWYGLVLVFLGVSCFLTCYQTRAMLKAEGPWGFQEDSTDYSAAMWQPESPAPRRRKLSRRAVRKLRRLAQAEESEQRRIDDILKKVSAQGMASLTWTERRELRKATERQRDIEVPTDAEPRL